MFDHAGQRVKVVEDGFHAATDPEAWREATPACTKKYSFPCFGDAPHSPFVKGISESRRPHLICKHGMFW